MSIQETANSIGGALILIFLFWQVFEKVCGNFEWFQKMKKKKLEAEQEKQRKIIKDTTEKLAEQILTPIIATLEEKNSVQDAKLDKLLRSSNDMIRKDIVRIYYKYLPYKKILQYDKEFVCKLYNDYHEQGGNSFIDGIMKEIRTWLVVLSEEDLV